MSPPDASSLASLPPINGGGNLPDQVAALLKQAIMEGLLAPGQRLNSDVLATHFRVSRIPVREALRALHTSGWVRIEPRLGVYVRDRDADELRDLFETRTFLEERAARLAATRRTAAQMETLDALVAEGYQAASSGQRARIGEVNSQFHEALVRCTGNSVLAEVLVGLSERVRWYYSAVSEVRGAHSMAEHEELVEAIRRQDADQAATLIRQHIQTTGAAVERVLR